MIWRLQYPPYLITFLETEQKNRGYFKTASIFLSGIFEDTDLAALAHLEYLSLPWEPPSVGLRRPSPFHKKRRSSIFGTPFLGNYILVDTMYYSPCRGRRWSAECCWFKVVEVVDFYILLPRAMFLSPLRSNDRFAYGARFYGAPTNFVSEWGERRH